MHDLVTQPEALRKLNRIRTGSKLMRLTEKDANDVSLLALFDAARYVVCSLLCYIYGVLIDDLNDATISHALSWFSLKSTRLSVKLSGLAEILACGTAVDESMTIADAFKFLLGKQIPFLVVVDSENLFRVLSISSTSSDQSICTDVNVIRCEFRARRVYKVDWIHVNLNIADTGTKQNSPADRCSPAAV